MIFVFFIDAQPLYFIAIHTDFFIVAQPHLFSEPLIVDIYFSTFDKRQTDSNVSTKTPVKK